MEELNDSTDDDGTEGWDTGKAEVGRYSRAALDNTSHWNCCKRTVAVFLCRCQEAPLQPQRVLCGVRECNGA